MSSCDWIIFTYSFLSLLFLEIRPDILGKAFDTEESETSKEDLGEKLQDLDDEEEEFFKPEL